MRTTLDIADDVLLAVRERSRRENRTAGEILSELAREALTRRREAATEAPGESFFGFDPVPPRGPVISNDLVDQLREEDAG